MRVDMDMSDSVYVGGPNLFLLLPKNIKLTIIFMVSEVYSKCWCGGEVNSDYPTVKFAAAVNIGE